MSISVNRVRNLVLYFISKNNYGYCSPEELDSYGTMAQLAIFEDLFFEYNNVLNKKNRNLSNTEYGDLKKFLEEQIDVFSEYSTPSNFTFNNTTGLWSYTGTDLYRAMGLSLVNNTTNKKVDIQEVTKGAELNKIINSNMVSPTTTYPIFTKIGTDFKVYPTTITGNFVELFYLRKPKDVKWAYVNVNGNPQVNMSASDYQDFELLPSLFEKLVVKILGYVGISLRENEITALSVQEEQMIDQKHS